MMKCADEVQANLYKKFPKEHIFSDKDRVDVFLQWVTYFRRNLNRFAETYFGIKLHWYQAVVLYLMGTSDFFCWIACRAASKTFIIALYACCMCVLYPGYMFVICSATRGQAKIIVTEKIIGELMQMSPALCAEIERYKDSTNDIWVKFKNGSTISVVTASDSARGHRANGFCAEEFRMIDKKIIDSVIAPFLIIRTPPYMFDDRYANIPELKEETKEIYISSAWMCNNWMWPMMKRAAKDMCEGKKTTIIGNDYSVVLRHNLKSREQLIRDKKNFDPITWAIEYQNIMLKDNVDAYFTYSLLNNCQVLKMPFFPRRPEDSPRKFSYPKQKGEIRIITCDIAMIDNAANDQSVYTLIRMLPEVEEDIGEDSPRISYQLQIPYLEAKKGTETLLQATRIKQLFYIFDADYCVLDCRNAGVAIAGALGRVIYDEQFNREYPAWSCINNADIAKHMPSSSGIPVLYAFTASVRLNSEIAVNLRSLLVDKKIDLLIPRNAGVEELLLNSPEYAASNDGEEQYWWERPYLETQALVAECVGLRCEKLENTGAIRLKERPGEMKDRFSSLAMGCYFASELEHDLDIYAEEDDLKNAPTLVSKLVL